MKIEHDNKNNYIKFRIKDGEYTSYISLAGDASNCKLSYIHQAGNMRHLSNNQMKEVIDFSLRYLKGCVIINTIDKKVAEFFKNTYKIYYHHEVPIGYSDGFQYHFCIKNDIEPNRNCKDPKPLVKVKVKTKLKPGNYSKTRVEKELRKVLKESGKDTRFVNTFIRRLTS